MIFKKHPAPSRRRAIGAVLGAVLGAATLAATTIPAQAQSQGSHDASSAVAISAQVQSQGSRDASSTSFLSPKKVAEAFYASYNGDLAAGFESYISKDLVLHGFDGPNNREAWLQGDLDLKASLTGYRLDVLDQIVGGNKVVTRWTLGGVHTGTIFGIPPSGREVHLSGISIDRVVDGQSVEHWSEGNFGRFLDELRGESTPSGQ